jgi:hypothetical protein
MRDEIGGVVREFGEYFEICWCNFQVMREKGVKESKGKGRKMEREKSRGNNSQNWLRPSVFFCKFLGNEGRVIGALKGVSPDCTLCIVDCENNSSV